MAKCSLIPLARKPSSYYHKHHPLDTQLISFENKGLLKQKIFGVTGHLSRVGNASVVLRNITVYNYEVAVDVNAQVLNI